MTTGAYTIYGGMKSSAWTDFMQMMRDAHRGNSAAGSGTAAKRADWCNWPARCPEKFDMFLPPTHEQFPWTGVFTGFLTVGLWYTCASQHIVQRVLSAKDEWHARMGVVSAGFLRILTPLFFVVPGIAAFKLFPDLERPDHAYLMLVKTLIPTGLKGLMLAGMAAALMSTVSTVLNSTSTLLTIDLYKKLVRPQASDREQVVFGMVSGVVVLIASIFIAFSVHRESGDAVSNWCSGFSSTSLRRSPWFSAGAPLAAGQRDGGGRDDRQRVSFPVAAAERDSIPFTDTVSSSRRCGTRLPGSRRTRGPTSTARCLTWIFCMIVMIVDFAPDDSAAAGAGRPDHLEPQLPLVAAGRARRNTAAGRTFASGGCLFIAIGAGDLRIFPVVRLLADE